MAESENPFDGIGSKKVGKVPMWAAAAMLAVVFIGVMYLRNRKKGVQVQTMATDAAAGAIPASDTTTGTFDPTFGLPNGAVGQWLSQNPTYAGFPTGIGVNNLPPPITNQQWAHVVSDMLLSMGGDPTLVTNAITKYLNGDTLTAAEQAVVNEALRIPGVGTPPEGVTPVHPPVPTPGKRTQGYHPAYDKNAGAYAVQVGSENWTNYLQRIAYAFGWTDPQQVWNLPQNAALREKYGNTVPMRPLAAGDVVYANYNPGANWTQMFPYANDQDPYLTAAREGYVSAPPAGYPGWN